MCTYQAISGAGKTFETWPEMVDNVIPYIGGEEEKSEQEPLKLWGKVEGDRDRKCRLAPPSPPSACVYPFPTAIWPPCSCHFSDGKKPSIEEIKDVWAGFKGCAQELELPSAPKQFLHYFEEDNRPQTKLDRNAGGRHGRLHRPPAPRHPV